MMATLTGPRLTWPLQAKLSSSACSTWPSPKDLSWFAPPSGGVGVKAGTTVSQGRRTREESSTSSGGHHRRYKTSLCQKYWIQGYCGYGPRCSFLHGEESRSSCVPEQQSSSLARLSTGSSRPREPGLTAGAPPGPLGAPLCPLGAPSGPLGAPPYPQGTPPCPLGVEQWLPRMEDLPPPVATDPYHLAQENTDPTPLLVPSTPPEQDGGQETMAIYSSLNPQAKDFTFTPRIVEQKHFTKLQSYDSLRQSQRAPA